MKLFIEGLDLVCFIVFDCKEYTFHLVNRDFMFYKEFYFFSSARQNLVWTSPTALLLIIQICHLAHIFI